MNTASNKATEIETIRAAGANAGRMGHGPERTNVDLGIWGPLGSVLRACAAIGMSRELTSTATRGPAGAVETVRIWTLTDLRGNLTGSIVHVSGGADASATLGGRWAAANA